MSPYLVRPTPRCVEAWSIDRLQFEPKDWQVDFRRDLRAAIARLHANPGEILCAVYSSENRERCDVENILFYNIGPPHFASSTGNGLRFERAFAPPPPRPDGGAATHYHRYEFSGVPPPNSVWQLGSPLASWSGIELPALTPNTNTAQVWRAMKRGAFDRSVETPWSCSFALRIRLSAPSETSLATIIKPLFDGTIAALHEHDGQQLDKVVPRLRGQLREEPEQIGLWLLDPARSVLGRRRLLWPWQDGVQWNPRDEDCHVGELLRESAATPWCMNGEVLPITP